MIGKHFIETSNKMELRINRVRINRARPVVASVSRKRWWLNSSCPPRSQTEMVKCVSSSESCLIETFSLSNNSFFASSPMVCIFKLCSASMSEGELDGRLSSSIFTLSSSVWYTCVFSFLSVMDFSEEPSLLLF